MTTTQILLTALTVVVAPLLVKIIYDWVTSGRKNQVTTCGAHENLVKCVAKVESVTGDTKAILTRIETKVDNLFDQAFTRIGKAEAQIEVLHERTKEMSHG